MAHNYVNRSSSVKVLNDSDPTEKPPCYFQQHGYSSFGLASRFGVTYEL